MTVIGSMPSSRTQRSASIHVAWPVTSPQLPTSVPNTISTPRSRIWAIFRFTIALISSWLCVAPPRPRPPAPVSSAIALRTSSAIALRQTDEVRRIVQELRIRREVRGVQLTICPGRDRSSTAAARSSPDRGSCATISAGYSGVWVRRCWKSSTPAISPCRISASLKACAATLWPRACASSTIAFISSAVNCSALMILIQSTPASISWRVFALASAAPDTFRV